MSRIDYERAAGHYDAARSMSPAAMAAWHEAVAPHLQAAAGSFVLDLGSGTGEWALAFAGWFGSRVVGVERSPAMRAVALAKAGDERIQYVAGGAETLPLAAGSCGLAWLSTVIHHFADLGAVARELRRVLRPSAPVLVRSSFPGRHDRIAIFRFFPAAAGVAARFPTVDETVVAFEAAGFRFESLWPVPQVSATSLADLRERVLRHGHADSTLRGLGEADLAAGLAAIDRAIAAGDEPGPVVDELDLLVLR